MHIRDRDGTLPLSIAVDRLGHIVVVVTRALVAALPLLTVIEHHGIIVLRLDADVDGVCSGRGRGAVSTSTVGLVILQTQTGGRGRAGGWRWRHLAHNATVTVKVTGVGMET